MKRVFADTYYFFSFLNKNEAHHQEARDFANSFRGELVTTNWVLTELADGMAKSRRRTSFASLYDDLVASPNVHVIGYSDDLFLAGLHLYRSREDKSWSLTDCVSFTVMQREKIVEALTADHHFEQAGFVALFHSDKPSA
jgi:predicted nucleic acid-binding protein